MSVLTAAFNPAAATSGTSIQTTDTGDLSAWDTIVRNGSPAGTITYDNTHVLFGKSLACKVASNAAAAVLEWTTSWTAQGVGSAATTDFGRTYIYLNALPAAAVLLVTAGQARIQLNTNGTISTKNSSTTLATSTTALSAGQWYRLEWSFLFATTAGAGVVECKIYTTPDSSTAAETLTTSATTNTATSMILGCNASATITFWLAQVADACTAYPGPYPVISVQPTVSGSAPVGSTLTCDGGTWNGTFTLGYQWTKDGSNIVGATSSTYVTQSGDATHAIGCTVTATGQQATNESASSASSNTVTPTSSGGSISTVVGKTGTGGTAVMQKAASGWTYITGKTGTAATAVDQKGAGSFTKIKGH